jgi:hypothetical protein
MASIVLVDAIAAIARASNFLAARDFASTASLCYAKIAPAGLHRGDFDGAIANTPKLLERYRNPSCAILFELSSAPVAPMM